MNLRSSPATTVPRISLQRSLAVRPLIFFAALALSTLPSTSHPATAAEVPAAPDGDRPSQESPVVPPGQEEALANMFGKGLELPGQCRFSGGNVNGATITVTYDCASGHLELIATHPTLSETALIKTDKFSVRATSGTPPEGFLDALSARIRENEGSFQWSVPKPKIAADSDRRPALIAVASVAAVGAGWLVRRSRSV